MTQEPHSHRNPPDRGRGFLRRISIRNYKSIGKCDVQLGALTVLVGRNGSGKSNFLDTLRFVVDSLQTSLDHAVKSRGGIDAVRRRSTGHPRNFSIALELGLPEWKTAKYSFEIAARPNGGFVVKQERLRILKPTGEQEARYTVEEGELSESDNSTMPPAAADRLYLVTASGLPKFRPVYDALTSMGFYNPNPDAMKELQSPDAGELLRRDGSNIASVIARLNSEKPAMKERVRVYLSTIVPGITDVERIPLGPRETLRFRQEVVGSKDPWKFYAASMSDGTLRSLGALVAVTQLANATTPIRLVGIEEPETALHPAAAGSLMDALREATDETQVLITTHSPELLDQATHDTDRLIAVQAKRGNTELGPIDPASATAIKNHLYTPGELLRMDQLEPDAKDIERQNRQLRLFDEEDQP